MAYPLLPTVVYMGEVPQLLTWTVTNFDSDIRLDFLAHHDSPEEQDDIMFPPEILQYMHKAVLKEEEEEWRREITAKEKLPEIFEGNPSEAENFIYEFAAYFMAHDDEPVLASPVTRVALTSPESREKRWINGLISNCSGLSYRTSKTQESEVPS